MRSSYDKSKFTEKLDLSNSEEIIPIPPPISKTFLFLISVNLEIR